MISSIREVGRPPGLPPFLIAQNGSLPSGSRNGHGTFVAQKCPAPTGTRERSARGAAQENTHGHRPYCNAPYARVLRVRIARISAAFSDAFRSAALALIDAGRHGLAVISQIGLANLLINLGTIWLPPKFAHNRLRSARYCRIRIKLHHCGQTSNRSSALAQGHHQVQGRAL